MAAVENANNLGAPASGFGQDVSFAIKPGQVPDERVLSGATPVVAGVDGSPEYRAQDHTIVAAKLPEDHTYAMLLDAAGQVMGPKIKEARTQAFVKGMQQAAQGEAVKDIVENQPWYSRIFGDSDAVAGARAYSGHAQAATAAAAIEDQMTAMRELSPADAQKVFAKTINESMTGEPGTDAQIFQTLSAQLPALARRQAKEHYGWQQGKAAEAEGKSMMAGARALQATAQGSVAEDRDGNPMPGSVRPEEFAQASQNWVRSIAPTAGRDAASWQISTTKTLTDMANAGLFHALTAFDKAGGFDALTEDQRSKVMTRWDSEEKSQRSLNSAPYMKQIIDIKASMHDPIALATNGVGYYEKRLDDVNAAYTARTGSRLGIFSPEEKTAVLTQGVQTIRAARLKEIERGRAAADKLTDQAAKATAKAETIKATAGQFKQGNIDPDAPADETRAAWSYLRNTAPQDYIPAVVNTFYQGNHATDKVLEGQMQGAVSTSVAASDPKALMTMYQNVWLPIYNGTKENPSGDVAAAAYMGDYGKKMRRFHDILTAAGPDPQAQAAFIPHAFNSAFIMPDQIANISDTDKHDKAILAATKNTLSPGIIDRTFNDQVAVRPDQLYRLAGMVKKGAHADQLDEHDIEVPVGQAVSSLKRNQGLQVKGGYFWLESPGTQPLEKALDVPTGSHDLEDRVPPDAVSVALRDSLEAKYKQQGISGGRVTLMRDKGQGANFIAVVDEADGSSHIVTLTRSEIVADYRAKKQYASPEAQRERSIDARRAASQGKFNTTLSPTTKFGDAVPQ